MLEDRVVIITGGARGIGKEVAGLFVSEGAKAVICDVNPQDLENSQKDLSANGAEVMALQIDVTKADQVEDMVNKTLDKFGKIDILINNAGITRDALLMRMKESDWDAVLNVNLKGTFNCIKAVMRPMMKQRKGKIVNIASIIGLMGNAGQANYAASKGGVIALTKTAAKELASRNVNVNAIAPGFIQTEMTKKLPEASKEAMLKLIPTGKFGQPLDVAKTALFLASELSDYITGEVIKVDGGMVM
ncbi:MAG: 3-oxoacyl-[acyl-carrier-protein] reductase [Candidatus Omnitrophica bacterium]|nr:3-oxoacyl-[acyl-carrier-protein] reductase [Candidatus Omnitrophota bacterium]